MFWLSEMGRPTGDALSVLLVISMQKKEEKKLEKTEGLHRAGAA
jgi:hypothetical protein